MLLFFSRLATLESEIAFSSSSLTFIDMLCGRFLSEGSEIISPEHSNFLKNFLETFDKVLNELADLEIKKKEETDLYKKLRK